jgi:protein O-mannosyl-transferase
MKKTPIKKGRSEKQVSGKFEELKQPGKENRYFDLAGLAVIILLGIVIYSNSFNCSFHFDDYHNIADNSKIRDLSDVKAWWSFYPARPVGIFTFVLNYHFCHLDVRYWHLVNLMIHIINGCLVWWLTLLIFSSTGLKENPVLKHRKVIAILTALLFVSHPLATQSVTYIVQRLASLAAMFYLLSLALYVKARLSDKGTRYNRLLFAGSIISAVLAMLTKENAFTLPFAIVLYEIFFLRTRKLTINFKDWRIILLMTVFLGILMIIPLKYSFSVFKPIPPGLGNTFTITPVTYLFTQFSVIVKYIQLLLLPINQNLDYDFPLSNNFFEIRTLLSFLVLSGLVFLGIFIFKKLRIISFGILWFFLTLSIESGFIPINDLIFEHRTYLPSFGFFLIISSGLGSLLYTKYKYLAVAIFLIIIGSNSFLTFERNKVWRNDFTLWSDVLSKSPDKARAILNLGVVYGTRGNWDSAIAEYSRAIGKSPRYAEAYYNRGVAYGKLGQWSMSIPDYTKATDIIPNYSMAWYNRGVSYWNLGKWDKAISDYTRTIEIFPQYAQAYSNRGIVYANSGKWDKAIDDYTAAIRINSKYADPYYNRGIAYGHLGKWTMATEDYTRAIEINPKYTIAYSNRGLAYGNLGQRDKAISDYTRAIELDPKNSTAYSNRGTDWGILGQWDKAIADYSNAIGINPNYATAYYNRGNAYANTGQWDKAVTDYTRAIQLDPNYTKAYSNREIARRRIGDER